MHKQDNEPSSNALMLNGGGRLSKIIAEHHRLEQRYKSL